MISKLHQRLGTAGFIISIVALVAALGGGAYAASGGLTGKQKKEVEKIAKQYAGKPGKNGAPGAKGDAGANGSKGDPGTNGTNGTDGGPGSNGVSVSSEEFSVAGKDGKCVGIGGTKFTSASGATYSCNGKEGSPWAAGGTLPAGATETGTFGGAIASGGAAFIPVTLTIPSEAPLIAIYVAAGKEFNQEGQEVTEGGCAGIQGGVPTAEPGFLCMYATTTLGPPNLEQIANPAVQYDGSPASLGAATSGALLLMSNAAAGEAILGGIFAATAEA